MDCIWLERTIEPGLPWAQDWPLFLFARGTTANVSEALRGMNRSRTSTTEMKGEAPVSFHEALKHGRVGRRTDASRWEFHRDSSWIRRESCRKAGIDIVSDLLGRIYQLEQPFHSVMKLYEAPASTDMELRTFKSMAAAMSAPTPSFGDHG